MHQCRRASQPTPAFCIVHFALVFAFLHSLHPCIHCIPAFTAFLHSLHFCNDGETFQNPVTDP
jgi:hypothetical protein